MSAAAPLLHLVDSTGAAQIKPEQTSAAASTSITLRLNLLLVAVVTILLSLSATSEYMRARDQRLADVDRQVTAILHRGAKNLPSAVWNFDNPQIEQIMQAEMDAPFVLAMDVTQDGKILAAMSRDSTGKLQAKLPDQRAEQMRTIALQYTDKGETVDAGVLSVHMTLDGMRSALLADLRWMLLRASILLLVLVTCLSFALTRMVFTPIMELVRTAIDNIARGEIDLTQRLPPGRYRELNTLTQGLNDFTERLHGVVRQVRASSETVASGSREIAQGIQALEQRTETQTDSVSKLVSSVSGLSQTVQQTTASAGEASRMAKAAESLVEEGSSTMVAVDNGMVAISERSRKIASIIDVIDSIAFQTNILALNAAVESARAGEQGRGFAVVAAEVRALAQRSTAAAKEIKSLISDSTAMTEVACKHAARAGQTMQEIVTAARGVATTIAEISRVSDHQLLELGQIGRAIGAIEEGTQSNGALVQKGSAAAISLRDQAQTLLAVTDTFKIHTGR